MQERATIPLLIVEDDPVFARFVRQLVLSLGSELRCEPEWVDTAGKALTALAANVYPLALLDYNLPDADGVELLGGIRGLPGAHQPAVIMLTASGNEAVAVEAMKRGAKDYLTKAGLDRPSLMRALQAALTQKQLADEVAQYHAQIEADLELARNLQRSLLPDRFPVFPRPAQPEQSLFRFVYRFQPAARLAGDFFNVLALSDHEAGVFICDVMGHGVRAALVTAILRTLVDELAPEMADPARLLAEVNRRVAGIFQHDTGSLFATALYLVADGITGDIRYANAGHPVPLHLCSRAGWARPLPVPRRGGPALGLFPEASYVTVRGTMAEGDCLLFYTDGIIEVEGTNGEADYGPDRLLAGVRSRLRLSLERMLDELIEEARQVGGNSEFSDDVCLLAMGTAGPFPETSVQEKLP